MASADSLLKADHERCDWVGCHRPAEAAYNDVEVIPEFQREAMHVGRIALCLEHMDTMIKQRRLQLDWDRVIHTHAPNP